MTSVLVTGGSGLVGRFIVNDLVDHGYTVTIAGRNAPAPQAFASSVGFVPLDLDPGMDFGAAVKDYDHLVHAAFSHVPGRYRNGEGDDVAGFWQSNFLSTLLLFRAAAEAAMCRAIFMSSRAVYGVQEPGAGVDEESVCRPDTHYGAVKYACERHFADLSEISGLGIASLRATGVYGTAKAGGPHKWSGLFDDYLSGKPVEPRCGTEVHGTDIAAAVRLMLECNEENMKGLSFNVSDLFLDRRDLLALVKQRTGCVHPLPAAADRSRYNVASTARLKALGWRPGGMARLETEIGSLIGAWHQSSPS